VVKLSALTDVLIECSTILPNIVERTLVDQLKNYESITPHINDKELERELKRLLRTIDYVLVNAQLSTEQRRKFKKLRKILKNSLY